jgi:phosphoglycerate kinase
MRLLAPWAGQRSDTFSVAVLGGRKKEKITIGLKGFAATYDAIIPGGIVLNTALKVRGLGVGESVLTDDGKSFEKDVAAILDTELARKLLLPDEVLVARRTPTGFRDVQHVNLRTGAVPEGAMIVCYILSAEARAALGTLAARSGRLVVAGTPDLYARGFGLATAEIVAALKAPGVQGIVLGGDTAAEIKFSGTTSTGGGSAV